MQINRIYRIVCIRLLLETDQEAGQKKTERFSPINLLLQNIFLCMEKEEEELGKVKKMMKGYKKLTSAASYKLVWWDKK